MSSMRGRRAPDRDGVDAYGDRHYPGRGPAAKGLNHNPALYPGSRVGYIYDWASSWPSGSNAGQPPPANGSATYGGLTLTNTGLPANAGVITATGATGEDTQILVLMSQDGAAGEFNIGGTVSVSAGTSLTDVATAISDMLSGLDNMLCTSTGAVVNYNLQSAGTIGICVIFMDEARSGGAVTGPIMAPLPPGGQDGPNTSMTGGPDYYISRSGGLGMIWYVEWDVVPPEGSDVKVTLAAFQQGNFPPAYIAEVTNRATELGWGG